MSLRSTKLSLCIRRRGDLENIPKTIERLKSLEKLEKIEADARKRHPFQAFGTQRDVASIEAAYDWGVNIAELRELTPIGQRRLEIEKEGEICLPVGEYIRDPNYKYFENGLIFSSEWDFFDALGDIKRRMETDNGIEFAFSQTFYVRDADLAALCSITPTRTLGSVKIPVPMSNFIVSPEFLESNISRASFDEGGYRFISLVRSTSLCGTK
jgi:hypothetical protein